MTTSPTIVLVPGFWLGGWAWDAVADRLRADGFPVRALTLPGLETLDRDRSDVTLDDHIVAVVEAVRAVDAPVVLVGHSGAGEIITGAVDLVPDRVAHLVFVDSGPAADGYVGSADLAEDVIELQLPQWEQLESSGSSLAGLDDDTLERFRSRAVPHPAGPAREPLRLQDVRRRTVPVMLLCCSFPVEQVRQLIDAGHPWFAELARFDRVDLVDLPTGHWPMWSRPGDTAAAIVAAASGPGGHRDRPSAGHMASRGRTSA